LGTPQELEKMFKVDSTWRELLLLVASLTVGSLGKGDPLNINVGIEDINIEKISAEVSFLSLPIASNTLCMLFRNFQILDRLHECPVLSDPPNDS
jgi:hypothetical protein